MPAPLAKRHADHHLWPFVAPIGPPENRPQRPDRRFIAADHHPPRRGACVGQVDARSLINDPLAQRLFGQPAQRRCIRQSRRPVNRDHPVRQRRRRHVSRSNINRANEGRTRRPVPCECRECCNFQQSLVRRAIAIAFQSSLDHGFQGFDHPALCSLWHGEARLGGHRQCIGRQCFGPLHLRHREITQQPVTIHVSRDRARQ